MIHKYTLQTSAAFERIENALMGDTNDKLSELLEDIEYLLYKAKEIKNTIADLNDSYDYQSELSCPIIHLHKKK